MAGPVSALPAGSGAPTTEYDPKKAARSSFNGAEAAKLSVQEMLDNDPELVRIKEKIDGIETSLSKEFNKIAAFQDLGAVVKKFSDASENLMGKLDVKENAFDRCAATITTTDTSEGHISVSVKAGAVPRSFSVNVQLLATQNKIILGTANIDLATAVNGVIQAAAVNGGGVITAGGGGDFLQAIRDVAGPLSGGTTPINQYAKDLYLIAKKTFDQSVPATAAADLQNLKDRAAIMFGQMQLSPVSAGLATKEAAAVGAGCLLNAGEYTLYSGEGGLGAGPPLSVVHSIITSMVALVTAADAKTAAHGIYDPLIAGGDEKQNDPLAKYVIKAIDVAAAVAGATAQDVRDAATAAFNEYKAFCNVNFVDGDSLQTVIDKINNTTKYSGVSADTISLGANNYTLSITSQKTGVINNIEFFNLGDVKVNIAAAVVAAAATCHNKAGQGSIAYIDNVPILSNYNTITVHDADITLKKPNTSINVAETVAIGPDLELVARNIIDFRTAFDQMSEFLATQIERDATSFLLKDTAILGGEYVVTALQGAVHRVRSVYIGDNDEGFRSLSDIGITFVEEPADPENKKPAHFVMKTDFTFLEGKLKSPNGLENIRRLFEFSSRSSNPALKVMTHEKAYGNIDFRVSVDQAGGFNGNANQVMVERLVNGAWIPEYYDLEGIAGAYSININNPASPLNGMLLSYKSNANVNNMLVQLRQGCCDKLYHDLYSYVDQPGDINGGLVTQRIKSMSLTASRSTTESTRLQKQLGEVKDKRAREISAKLARASRAQLDTQMMEAYLDGLYGPQ